MDANRKHELARLANLAHAGAVRAAAAYSQLVAAEVVADAPSVHDPGPSATDRSDAAGDDTGGAGVFFEFEGCLDALVAILFPSAGSDRLVRSVVGIESGELDPTIVESALMEVGNILASHVASGIADALRSRLLPSIPALAARHAEAELEAWIDRGVGRDAARIESRLRGANGESMGRLVIVPIDRAAGTARSDGEARR